MSNLGLQTPTELLTSQITSVIGEFLLAQNLLVKLTRNADPNIVKEANKLLAYHSILENERVKALQTVENVKTGAYTMSDVIQATATMWAMVEHNKDVQELVNEAGGIPSSDIPWKTIILVAGAGTAAYLMFGRK